MMLKWERLVVSLSAARCCKKALPAVASVSAAEPEREKTPTEARRPGRLSVTTETPFGSFVICVAMGVDGTPTRAGTPGKGSSMGTEIGEIPWKIFQSEGGTGASLVAAATAWEEEDIPLRDKRDRRASMLVVAKRGARHVIAGRMRAFDGSTGGRQRKGEEKAGRNDQLRDANSGGGGSVIVMRHATKRKRKNCECN
jgi:hypothetical protein